MKRLGFVLIALVIAAPVFAQDKPASSPLTEVQQLKAELQLTKEALFNAQVQGAQCQATLADRESRLAGATLTGQQTALKAAHDTLERELVKQLKGDYDKGDRLDWSAKPLALKKAPKKEN